MINGPHLHLIVNHFPVIGILFSILLFLYGPRRNEEIKKISLGAFVLLALITVPVYFTGVAAEKVEGSEEPSRRNRGVHRQA